MCISTGDIPLNPEFIHTWSDTCRPLRHRKRNDRPSLRCCLPWRHHRVTWITCSPLWRSLIHRILKSLLPQNNTFFIATLSVVKDAADDPDCQELKEQWYYLRFYVRRTMPPTDARHYWSFNRKNPPVTDVFPWQMASNAENLSMSWYLHDLCRSSKIPFQFGFMVTS